ncbi:putative bifunctional diguanylate cyclase/phosphodiesterase [Aquipuribacter hungaricus]|uniref:putative bifunctional diguanylate cyclase/phosphodiesterase n=1 Tax=Aquipuribacter hungaricus TaxID=545624 RepID=UPI0030EB22A7
MSRRGMGRALGVLYLAGAALALLWTALPHGPGADEAVVATMAAIAAVMGAALAAGVADRAPLGAFHAVIGAIQVVISVGFAAGGAPDNDIRLFYLWATPFAAFYFAPRDALRHGVWSAACFATVLSLSAEPTPVLLRLFLLTMGSLAAVGLLVGHVASWVRRSRRELQHAAWHDSLSGLPNRELFDVRTCEALAARDRTGGAVHVLLVDLDHFKLVNDTYGHHSGDELITAVAGRLRLALGAGATVARMGGDEFAVVVADPTGDLDLDVVLARLPAAWAEPVVLSGALVPVSASVGVASATGPGSTAEQLLRDADVALYRAKDTQRGSVRRFDAVLRVEVERRTRLDHELHGAVARGEMSLVYQPVVDLAGDRTVGAEALLRWHSPTLGPVPPSEFVPVAEDNGLVVPIGRYVLEQAAADIARWRADGTVDESFTVAVNVSVRQLCSTFPEDLDRLLEEHGLPHGALTVEITESVLLDGSVFSGSVLSRLRRAGTRVSLDDFGTGYSSLSYLQRLPMDILKIDRSFVGELDGPTPRTGLVSAVLDLARSLGMDVVAEGVETPEQADRLRLLGVDRAQGWLFARPLRPGELVAHLGTHAPLV